MTATALGLAGTATYQNSTKTATLNIAVTRTILPGHTIVIYGGWDGTSAIQPILTIGDDAGNSGAGNVGAITGSTRQVVIGTLPIVNQLNSGANITLTADNTRSRWAFQAFEFSGLTSSPTDLTASANSTSATSLTGGVTSVPTSQANEVVFGAFCVGPNEVVTAASGFTLTGTAVTTFGTTDLQVAGVYSIVSAVGLQSAAASQATAGAYAGATLTLKAAAAQTLLPATDNTTTSWATTPSGASSFAQVTSDTDDTTYARLSTADGAHPLVEVLSNPSTTPPVGATVAIKVRARANSAASATGVLSIIQGSTTIASQTFTLTSSLAWYELDLTPTQVTTIANGTGGWNGLKVSFNPTAS